MEISGCYHKLKVILVYVKNSCRIIPEVSNWTGEVGMEVDVGCDTGVGEG